MNADRRPDAYTPSDREPLPSGLIPAERLALTVARRQIERGDNPPIGITTVLVMAINRLLGNAGQCIQVGESQVRTVTRDQLADALTHLKPAAVPRNGILEIDAEAMATAIWEVLDG